MRPIKLPNARLAAIGTFAIMAIIIAVQARTILDMRQKIRSLHSRMQQFIEQQTTTEDASRAPMEADAPKLNPEEPSAELLRLRGEVGVLRQQLQQLQERPPPPPSTEKLLFILARQLTNFDC